MSTELAGVLFFLGFSVLFYVLFGGADHGAGMVELIVGRKSAKEQRQVISQAMAPVWEANHVWLILAVVILFMGFPRVYTLISTYLYLPILAMLIGIVGRGCAFTFRHYDSLGSRYHKIYSKVFSLASLWTSLFLGIIAGAMMLGRIKLDASTASEAYLDPWWNLFSLSVGIFACTLFLFLALVYLAGEAEDMKIAELFRKKAQRINFLVMLAGALVFFCAEVDGLALFNRFFTNPTSLTCFIGASLLWWPFWSTLKKKNSCTMNRVLAVAILTLVMFGWFAVSYPALLVVSESDRIIELTPQDIAAPKATLQALLWALTIGSILILPALAYLLKIFKWESIDRERKSHR